MSWLEMVKVRGAAAHCPKVARSLCEQIQTNALIWGEWGLRECRLFTEVNDQCDVMLVLNWDQEEPRAQGSDLALALARELRGYGVVDHTLWNPRNSRPAGDGGQGSRGWPSPGPEMAPPAPVRGPEG